MFTRRSLIAGSIALAATGRRPSDAKVERLPDRQWEFMNFSTRQHILVERCYMGAEAVNEAMSGDDPFESWNAPIENAEEVDYDVDNTRAWKANLWGEPIKVTQVHANVSPYLYIVTADASIRDDITNMVVRSCFRFDKPRVPRGWSLNYERDLDG